MPAQVDELREHAGHFFAKFSPTYDDKQGFNIRRWATYATGNLDEVVHKLKSHLVLRRLLHLDDPDLVEKFERDVYPVVRIHRPFDPCIEIENSYDVDGRMMFFIRYSTENALKVYDVLSSREILENAMLRLEYRRRMVFAEEEKTGKPVSACGVYDMVDFSLKTIADFCLFLSRVTQTAEHNFPGVITRTVLLNCPSGFDLLTRVVALVVPSTMELKCVAKASPDAIFKIVTRENLPVAFRGDRTDAKRTLEESIAMPAMTVEEKRRLAKWPKNCVVSTDIKIKAGRSHEFMVEVPEGGQVIRWHFSGGNGGVQFAIYEGTEMTLEWLMVPKFATYTEEIGECVCERKGEYMVVFTNVNHFSSLHLSCELGVDVVV